MKFSVHGVYGEREQHCAGVFERMHRGERLTETRLTLVDAIVEGLDLHGSALETLIARQSVFSECRFEHADISGADCGASVIVDTAFDAATIVKASWHGCALQGVSFRRCKLIRTEFDTVRFDAVSFAGADLTGASFADSDLRGVDFRDATFHHTYFFDCLLDEEVAARDGVVRKTLSGRAAEGRKFVDLFVHREERFALGIEEGTATCFLSFPVSNPYVDYAEYYAITPRQLVLFQSSLAAVLPFLTACRERRNDQLLIVQPGRLRGHPA